MLHRDVVAELLERDSRRDQLGVVHQLLVVAIGLLLGAITLDDLRRHHIDVIVEPTDQRLHQSRAADLHGCEGDGRVGRKLFGSLDRD